MPTHNEVTLTQLLDARDRRRRRQLEYLSLPMGGALLVATLTIPGPVKVTPDALLAADMLEKALTDTFGPHLTSIGRIDPDTGTEIWLTADISVREAKRLAVGLEESHPAGRIFDIDVIGDGAVPVSRRELGLPERRCLLCGQPARHCMRARSHTVGELLARIHALVNGLDQPGTTPK